MQMKLFRSIVCIYRPKYSMPCFCAGLCLCTAASLVSGFIGFYVYDQHVKCMEEMEEECFYKLGLDDTVVIDTIYFDKQSMPYK